MRLPVLLALTLLASSLVACSKPERPENDPPVEPQATAEARRKSREPPATQLRDYMQAPIEKAKTAEDAVLDAGEQQRADIEAQTSGNASTPPTE